MAAHQQQPPLGLPPTLNPDTLDTLSDLAALLTRLRAGISSSSSSSTTAAAAANNSSNTSATNPTSSSTSTLNLLAAAAGGSTSTAANDDGGSPALALKDLPSQSDQLRHRFQKARALVRMLPDMERSTAEQEAEMRELEAKIARQKETLEKLKALGARFAEMGREEGDRMEE